MAHKAKDIAQWFINRASLEVDTIGGEYITPLKLQKMLYYAQGCYGAIFGERLFTEEIRAWAHGPVVEEVYKLYKGDKPITTKKEIGLLEERAETLLEEVNRVYGQYSAWALRNMTHEEEPWKETSRGEIIPFEKIVDYFKREVIEQ